MHRIFTAAGALLVGLPMAAQAASLRPFSQINASTVRLADLFDDLGRTPDRVLGPAPAPGAKIVVQSPQLAAIARDFDVDWRPTSGAEQSVVERRGEVLPRAMINAALRTALVAAGAPPEAEIAMPEPPPVTVPAGTMPVPDISQCVYDPSSSHFTALVSITAPEMPATTMRVSGNVIVLTSAAVPTHRLTRGAQIAAADIEPKRVRAGLLRGSAAIVPAAAIGMILKHDVAAGQPLTALDIERPELVQRGSLVHMSLVSDGISLGAEGIAHEPGAQGDRIHVENPNSHVMVEAVVTGPGEVRVSPRGAVVSLVSAQ
jgi:flagella basal body P-ring formation protein FlgA